MRIIKFCVILSVFITSLALLSVPASAQFADPTNDGYTGAEAPGPYIGLEVGAYTGLGTRDVRLSTSLIIRAAMGFLGIAATVIVLIGGYTWMTAGGNDDKISEAKKWIMAGVIGMVIIFSAYSISNFVLGKIIQNTINTNFVGE